MLSEREVSSDIYSSVTQQPYRLSACRCQTWRLKMIHIACIRVVAQGCAVGPSVVIAWPGAGKNRGTL